MQRNIHTHLLQWARHAEIIGKLLLKHFVPTKAICKFNQSPDSGHCDRREIE